MPASTDIPTDLDDISFLGRLSEALSQRIEEQTRPLFEDAGITVPVRSCSLLSALNNAGEATAAELARTLGQSHQLVIQKCPALLRLGLVTQHADPNDARRKIFRLTDAGRDQLRRLDAYSARITEVYRTLFEEVGDVHGAILKALDALADKPLAVRIRE
ncbi:MAG TPA: MarR family winged helix-turn-helix transcriptional regulator [Sphingopyxis sp.]|uniref:MarR family winged helix-turn-helix transcriptional regulator n=1 Tax=Sphingopyxis sp. TaxID=1908224 RepID=UPI002BE659E6|nr:MarR family winged helix-turn-helix transcriptional regulator [Sphingopyxis sp.]HWW55793.1 MarR family winged helix-turn-helix transcriptional regulator [Sphingopyxis sp.]